MVVCGLSQVLCKMQQSCSFFFFRSFGQRTWSPMDQFCHESVSTCKSVEWQPPGHSRHTFIPCYTVGGFRGPMWEAKQDIGDSQTIQEAPDPKEELWTPQSGASSGSSDPCRPPISFFTSLFTLRIARSSRLLHHVFLSAKRSYLCGLPPGANPKLFIMILLVLFMLASFLETSGWEEYGSSVFCNSLFFSLYKI